MDQVLPNVPFCIKLAVNELDLHKEVGKYKSCPCLSQYSCLPLNYELEEKWLRLSTCNQIKEKKACPYNIPVVEHDKRIQFGLNEPTT